MPSRHVVRVADPYFGSYVQVFDSGPINCRILIGPLFERVLHMETISNSGQQYKFGESTEKSCQHSYVEGTVSGAVPDGAWPDDEDHFWLGIGSSEVVKDTVFSGALRHLRTVSTSSSEDDTGTVLTLDIEVDYQYSRVVDNYMCNHYKSSITLEFVIVTGADGSKAYTLSSSSYVNDPIDTFYWSIGQVSCPFGSEGDNLLAVFGAIGDFASGFKDSVEKAGKNVSLRDASIYEALDNISLASINPLENIQELLDVLAPLKQISQLLKLHGFMGIIKGLASLHLFYKYVIQTGILDAKQWMKLLDAMCHPDKYIKDIKSLGLIGRGTITKEFVTDDGTEVEVAHSAKLVYSASTADITDLLNLLGLTPRLADLWDIVPYSFVIDWCLPIGDAINNLELNSLQQRFPFVYGILSKKVVGTIDREFTAGAHTYTLQLKVVSYNRAVEVEFPTDVWFGVSFADPTKHLLTGGALLIQKYL